MMLRVLPFLALTTYSAGRWAMLGLVVTFLTAGLSSGEGRSGVRLQVTPHCSTNLCLLQRVAGLGLLGLAALLALYRHRTASRRGKRDLTEDQALCNFLLLRPDEIVTDRRCYDR